MVPCDFLGGKKSYCVHRFYSEGHDLGAADAAPAGRLEGRIFGLEKGFEKFFAMACLQGQSLVLASRLPRSLHTVGGDDIVNSKAQVPELVLPNLLNHARLKKHIEALYAFVETKSLSKENTEEAVAEFDDRFKRAEAKIKVIERIIGEKLSQDQYRESKLAGGNSFQQSEMKRVNNESIEDDTSLPVRR